LKGLWRDPSARFEPSQGTVQGARLQPGAVEASDVLHNRVSMLWAASQAGEDEHGGLGEAPEILQLALVWARIHMCHDAIYRTT
jgi:hypothetical protein